MAARRGELRNCQTHRSGEGVGLEPYIQLSDGKLLVTSLR
jgi:hypothetical protein